MDTGAHNQLTGDALLLQELTKLGQKGDESAQRVLGGWDRKDPVQLRRLMVLPPPSKTHFLTKDFREMRKRVVQEGFRLTKAFELNNLIRDKQWQAAAMCTLLEESAAAWTPLMAERAIQGRNDDPWAALLVELMFRAINISPKPEWLSNLRAEVFRLVEATKDKQLMELAKRFMHP
jgi:hypothetical protein